MSKKAGELTPLMKQYWDVKTAHKDKLVFFRMGDFYELFYEDAVKASQILGLTLTQRNKKSDDHTPMCGFPHHSMAGYVNKLLSVGEKVAICDQIEDPALAKGLVRRAVTRILTPGMVYDNETLESSKAHYLASLDERFIYFLDSSTQEYFFYEISSSEQQMQLLYLMPVAEVLLNQQLVDSNLFWKESVSTVRPWIWTIFNEDVSAEKNLIEYLKHLNQTPIIEKITKAEKRVLFEHMKVSATTFKHLEIFENYKGETDKTLFSTLQKTKTAAGSRLLRQWVLFPLKSIHEIQKRQNQIEKFRQNLFELKKVREILASVGDIERRLNKIMQPQAHARDFIFLAESSLKGIESLNYIDKLKLEGLEIQESEVSNLKNLCEEILKTFLPDAPLSTKQGFMIQFGQFNELDELITLSTNSQTLLQEMENREKELTGISSLKIRYNNVFGYYIEITNTHKDKVPSRYQRKQTLANAERFCTDELIELEQKVLSAQKKRFDLEFEIFENYRKKILDQTHLWLGLSRTLSLVDVFSGLAWLSLENNYCRPEFTEDRNLHLMASRHPVVEQVLREKFVSNSVQMKSEEILLLTGPNMAGKSTLMRQVALIVLMAQMGSFVPCEKAQLPLYDSLFTRIGASDQLSEGLSTFMVEMTETAQMLSSATSQSLLILDEVGRGTGTFDGMSLAQALIEHLNSKIKCQVLFATHYHELSLLEKENSSIRNSHMKVQDIDKGHIEFLYVLMPGAAGKSYGIKVAELAGLPSELTRRAYEILHNFESAEKNLVVEHQEISESKNKNKDLGKTSFKKQMKENQISFFDNEKEVYQQKLIEKIKSTNLNETTPLSAFNLLVNLKQEIENAHQN